MKKLALSGKLGMGKFALVDDSDYDTLNRWRWQVHPWDGYVFRTKRIKRDGVWRSEGEFLHKRLCPSPFGMVTDHVNGDRLDNRRSNLRVATRGQNIQNAPVRRDNRLGYKGVVWRAKSRDYVAYINFQGRRICLKTYHSLEDAVAARRAAELKYYGEFAYGRA